VILRSQHSHLGLLVQRPHRSEESPMGCDAAADIEQGSIVPLDQHPFIYMAWSARYR